MKPGLLAIPFFLGAVLPTNGWAVGDGGILTADMIQRAGVTRIGELLFLVDEWRLNSTDGLTWRARPNGLSPFQRQNWIVLLDGQRIDLQTFDTINFYLLPVDLDEIDSVEVIRQPQLHQGEFADGGLIHIHTARPTQGLSFQAALLQGNETGDAGPYRFTPYATPNVDRLANDGSLSMTFVARHWYARAGLTVQQHPFTDRAMLRRISTAIDGWPGLHRSLSPRLRLGIETPRGRHEFMASYAYSPKYFFFFGPAAREIPVRNAFPHIGLNGTVRSSGNTAFTYRLKASQSILDNYSNVADWDFNWRLRNFHASLDISRKATGRKGTVGIGIDRYRLHTRVPLAENAFTIAKLTSALHFRWSQALDQVLSAQLSTSHGRMAVKTALKNRWRPNSGHTFIIHIAYADRLVEEDPGLWYWTERGYNALADMGVDHTINGQLTTSRQRTVDLSWQTDRNAGILLAASGYYRSFSDYYLEQPSLTFNAQDCSFYSAIQLFPAEGGQVWGGHLTFTHRPRPGLSQFLFYGFQTVITGGEHFKGVWQSIPRHTARYRLSWFPLENCSLWAMVSYLSSAEWVDYRGIDGQVCLLSTNTQVIYASRVASSTILDLQVQKWFWHRQLKGTLLFRNVGNRLYRYHPLGASFDLSFFIRLQFHFNAHPPHAGTSGIRGRQ